MAVAVAACTSQEAPPADDVDVDVDGGEPDTATVGPTDDYQRTIIFILGDTRPGEDLFLRGGLDHDQARARLGLECTAENLACALPIRHRNLRNATTAPWKRGDDVLDWVGREDGQTELSDGRPADGTAADWTTSEWTAELGQARTVAVDGFGLEPLNRFGPGYWMLDVDVDCSRALPAAGARWFEVKSFIANGAGWEPDVAQPGAPYPSPNHVVRCGAINVFRRGSSAARVYPLDAPPPASFRFVAVGDTGKGNQGQLDVARGIGRYCRVHGCDFAVLLGDNIYDSGVTSAADPQFAHKFETPYAGLGLPFHVVLGNHDYGGGGAGDEHHKGQFQIDYTRRSRTWRLPAAYYRWQRGEVELFALDTNAQMHSRDTDQARDVAMWITSSTARWKIAYGHHPYRSNGPHGDAGRYEGAAGVTPWSGDGVKHFFDAHICGQVDLYLSGHDHSRQWLTEPCGGRTELVVSGAGASASSLPGAHPTHFQSLALGFVAIAIEGGTLTAEAVDVNGQVEWTRTLTRP